MSRQLGVFVEVIIVFRECQLQLVDFLRMKGCPVGLCCVPEYCSISNDQHTEIGKEIKTTRNYNFSLECPPNLS